ncbi:MAG: RidA family protein, partial [Gemmatimonadetes bacterium]|nr:RidA family protein [Gemmatimonadota bacterium]
MNELSVIHTESAPAALGPYSQAIVTGEWVFCSGQIPIHPSTGELLEGSIAEQTERVLTNLAEVLAAAGSSLDRVVKTTVFLADIGDFAAMNEVYARRFGHHRPARSTIQAGALPRRCRVEIECIARRG